VRFELADPKAEELSRLLKVLDVAISVRTAERASMELELRCGERNVKWSGEL
jgi:hypothetical protein